MFNRQPFRLAAKLLISFFNVLVIALLLISSTVIASDKNVTAMDELIQAATRANIQIIVLNPNSEMNAAPKEVVVDQRSDLAKFREKSDQFRNSAQAYISLLPEAQKEIISILRARSPDGSNLFYVEMILYTLLFFAVGYVFTRETYGKRIVGPWFRLIAKQNTNPVGYSEKLPILVMRFILGAGGMLLIMLVAYILDSIVIGKAKTDTQMLSIGYIYASFAMINLVSLLWRMILSPFLPGYRIPKFHPDNLQTCTAAAKKLYMWLWIGATMGIIFYLTVSWLGELGVSSTSYGVLDLYLTGISALYSIALIVCNRKILTGAILQGKKMERLSIPARMTANFWVPLSIAYFFVAWLDLAYDLINGHATRLPLIASTYFIILSVIVVYAIVSYVIEQFFQRKGQFIQRRSEQQYEMLMQGGAEQPLLVGEEIHSSQIHDQRMAESSILTFEDLATRVASMLALIAGFYALLNVWNIDDLLHSNTLINNSYDVIFVLFAGYIGYNFFKIWIDDKITAEGGQVELSPGDEGGAAGASRVATLLPLFRNFLLVLIFVSVTLIALMEMGINVAPLFAGAGVVGLAIGFGAQTLVRDVFSGAFFLFDDAFRKGEYIDLGEVKGTVEKISVRSFQLRHHLGRLHTVPFGEIKFLTNYSRDWVMMKLPLRVTYDTDVEKVRKLVKKLGQKLLEDPELGPQFLQPLKSQGVIEMQDSAMIIRVKFMTKPGDQWVIRKTVYAKIRELFIQEGIKFAHREVTVRLADNQLDQLPLKQKQQLAGAAAISLEEPLVENDLGNKDKR
ncbi:MAG: mechanosensitive ion channel [Pseudomonadales bacterium]|nr:mechanosensitive ion channel [Pseudomonadales bacterium]